jgi:hypothetical protein
MTRKFPLLVQFELHPASKEAAAAAEYPRDAERGPGGTETPDPDNVHARRWLG